MFKLIKLLACLAGISAVVFCGEVGAQMSLLMRAGCTNEEIAEFLRDDWNLSKITADNVEQARRYYQKKGIVK